MKSRLRRTTSVILSVLSFLCVRDVAADDWPAYKKGPARTGLTAEELEFPLVKKWVYRPSQLPRPAWPEPGKELNRTDFDYAFQPVVAGGLVYFGSSADDTVRALAADTTQTYDYCGRYVDDLGAVLEIDAIRDAGIRIGADPLGGASVDFWGLIADRHRLDLTVVNPLVDPTWRFMTLDWDGKIRMDCSSPDAMASLIANRQAFQISTGIFVPYSCR